MADRVDVIVIGAGVFGLSCALHLADVGAYVRLVDAQGAARTNASSIAAGMLAPASEALAEGCDQNGFKLLLHARDRWPAFADRIPGLIVHRDGADVRLSPDHPSKAILRLLLEGGVDFDEQIGAEPIRLPQDWRVDVQTALAALDAALEQRGVERVRGVVTADAAGRLAVDGERLVAETVVIAAGFQAVDLAPAAPELASLSPIKGAILHFAGPPLQGRTQRTSGGYVVPQNDGARAGGTMEVGRADALVDAAVSERLSTMALAIAPDLAGAAYTAHAGVRAATPDGWPLAGWSQTPGVLLATGARRNGWLLAPLIGEIIADLWRGAEPDPCARLFHPGRFNR
ncbi:FAD-dependent oxidoreductase [soil metagenome]